MYRLMLIDDDSNILAALKRMLRRQKDWRIDVFSDPRDALDRAREDDFDLFLSDYKMPFLNGVELLSRVKGIQPDAARLILSGYAELDAVVRAVNDAEIYRFIAKPVEEHDLVITIRQALGHCEILKENKRLANLVRTQELELNNRRKALEQFAEEHPVLAAVNWAEDGSIILDVE